ncbi:MAG: cytochrome c [Actinobacteria bacterium]|nr:cytochrome c [Actinomycetota bacterium]
MKNSFYVGVVFIAAGLIGLAAVFVVYSAGTGSLVFRPAAESLGAEIFLYGTAGGRAVPRRGSIGMMGGSRLGCADCHGTDGRGGRVNMMMMMGSFEAPDIRWSTLTSTEMEHTEGETPHPPFDRDSFARALRDGVDPDGGKLESPMPRWGVNDAQVDALIEYLQGL